MHSKATIYGDIPEDILKSSINIHLNFLTDIITESFRHGECPNILKYAEVLPVQKKRKIILIRPVSALSLISKIFGEIDK